MPPPREQVRTAGDILAVTAGKEYATGTWYVEAKKSGMLLNTPERTASRTAQNYPAQDARGSENGELCSYIVVSLVAQW